MKNKPILFGLFFALLHATSTKGADPDDGSLTINVDAGKDTDSFLSLAEAIEGKQSLIDDQLAKSTAVATPQKRSAELACEKITNDLRSIGESTFDDLPYSVLGLYSDNQSKFCRGALIDKRFIIMGASCVSTHNVEGVSFDFDLESKKIKAVHIHPDFSSETPSLNNIALIELESDVAYTSKWYPVCLYTSQVNSERYLMGLYGEVRIVADAECFNRTGTDLKPSQICATDLEFLITYTGWPIYLVQENFPTHKLFGIVARNTTNSVPFVITKVFGHLNFIKGIVWPKTGN
ncbi:serine protease persephone-like isoform X1 [Zeugodacus cucurbitae]|uniref:serine protease persephone-like isoform X1 n=1 Tax=Zeugodacus cucurbitae TaxID=28588 RepID=UPI0023D90971|nr:serine protease persephone-like isoform X1 [Zeugodacus cucurbitae]